MVNLRYSLPMRSLLALLGVILSGLYLLVMVPTIDPLPFLDEGLMLMVLLNCLAFLGLDLRDIFGLRSRAVPVRVRSRRIH